MFGGGREGGPRRVGCAPQAVSLYDAGWLTNWREFWAGPFGTPKAPCPSAGGVPIRRRMIVDGQVAMLDQLAASLVAGTQSPPPRRWCSRAPGPVRAHTRGGVLAAADQPARRRHGRQAPGIPPPGTGSGAHGFIRRSRDGKKGGREGGWRDGQTGRAPRVAPPPHPPVRGSTLVAVEITMMHPSPQDPPE